MSQPAPGLEITLPDGWEATAQPLGGASMQAYEPAGNGFRSSLTIHAFVPAEISDTPPEVDELHAMQIADMLQALVGAQELESTEVGVNGLYARCSVVGFRKDEYTVLARVWTIQAHNGVLQVAGLCDAQRVVEIGPQINAAVESLTIKVDPNFEAPARP